jgi:hypothetical protein
MGNRLRAAYAALFAALLFVPVSFAQTSRGAIAGTVVDATDAAIPGATVTAKNKDNGQTRTTETGPTGGYRLDAVDLGQYQITVQKSGFQSYTVDNVTVRGSVITPLDATLKVSGSNEIISVEAQNNGVQTETGELSGTISTQEVQNLPIANTNPYSLAATLPGVTTLSGQGSMDMTNGASFAVNGNRPRGNNFLIEGQDNNDTGIHGQGLQPGNLEAVKEVTVLTNAYQAEFGNSGGSVSNVIYQSGTNQFHGSAWDRLYNSSFDAADKQDILNQSPKAKYRENMFGFTLGGPVLKDKLFFFTSYQWDNYRSTANGDTLTVPTAAGYATLQSLPQNQQIKNLLTAVGNVRGLTSTTCIALGNDASGNPRPCVEVGKVQRSGIPNDTNSPEFDAKGDYILSTKDTLGFRYIKTNYTAPYDFGNFPSQLPGFDTEQSGAAHNAGITYQHVFSPALLNEARLSYGRIGFTFDFRPDTYANPLALGPTISISELTGFGAPSGLPQGRFHDTYQLQDALSWTKGNHFFKFGFDEADIRTADAVPFNFYGAIGYAGAGGYTSLANYIDDIGGKSTTVSKTFGNPISHVNLLLQSYYAQDTWKVKSNLTLDAGLRYEYQGTPVNMLQYPAMDPKNIDCFPCRVTQKPDRNNFGPRVGFAYTPHFLPRFLGEDKTVIRGAFGVFYDTFFTNLSDNNQSTSPNAVAATINSSTVVNPRGTANWSQVFNTLSPVPSAKASVNTIASNLVNPEILQWNLNVQRELPASFLFTLGYVGTRGEHLFANTRLNPLDPNTGAFVDPNRGAIVFRDNSGDSIYHGMEAELERHFTRGLMFRTSYTFSKYEDDTSEVFTSVGSNWSSYPVVQYPSARKTTDWGLSAFDHRQRVAISYVYDVPKWNSARGFATPVKYVINGWQWSGQTAYQSGAPTNIEVGYDVNGDGITNDRPNLGNPAAPVATYGWAGSWFGLPDSTICDGPAGWSTNDPCHQVAANSVHWIVPAYGTAGNVGRNTGVTPWTQQWDMGIQRSFNILEKQRFDFRAEMFNLFNHGDVQAENINTSLVTGITGNGTPTFMNNAITVKGHRNIRFLLKYSF